MVATSSERNLRTNEMPASELGREKNNIFAFFAEMMDPETVPTGP
jgi:hypothetical protein